MSLFTKNTFSPKIHASLWRIVDPSSVHLTCGPIRKFCIFKGDLNLKKTKMAIPQKIAVPKYPKFLPSPDQNTMELYITCTSPLALIWVRQTTPAQLFIIEGPQEESILRECADWYRQHIEQKTNKN
jgi:hypothetical protein